jgi:hypothetical protein
MGTQNLASFINSPNLPDNHERSSLIDDVGIMTSVFLGDFHGQERAEESAARGAQSTSSDAAEDRTHARKQRPNYRTGHSADTRAGHGSRGRAFGSILLELQTGRARNYTQPAVRHVNAIRRETPLPQCGDRSLRLSLLVEYADHEIFSWFNHGRSPELSCTLLPRLTRERRERPSEEYTKQS